MCSSPQAEPLPFLSHGTSLSAALTLARGCRLTREASPAVNALPARWLDALTGAMQRPSQSRNNILRRSAGLPVAVLAVLLADPPSARRVCLPWCGCLVNATLGLPCSLNGWGVQRACQGESGCQRPMTWWSLLPCQHFKHLLSQAGWQLAYLYWRS